MSGSTTRVPLIAGNWKMHKTSDEARSLTEEILEALGDSSGCDIGLFPPATALAVVAEILGAAGAPESALVGAQNMHFEAKGAFTGEIAASMILACGGNSVLIGHSERRHVFGETDDLIGKKVAAAIAASVTPILCVGETIEERQADRTTEVVQRQLVAGLEGVESAEDLSRVIIAYEPVWAIGTGLTATPEQAQAVHEFSRNEIGRAFASKGGSAELREGTRILYGGSVKPENAAQLLSEPDIDGALVGGASLEAASFAGICAGASAQARG